MIEATMIDNSAELSERVFMEYKSKIYGYIIGKGVPLTDRDDVFSEILLKATAQKRRYDSSKSSLSTWVYIICRSVVTDYYRKRKAEHPITESTASDFDLEQRIEYESELSELAEQLRNLADRERKIIILRLYKNMKFSQVARFMDLPETNVRAIYSRAVKKLRKRMAYAE